jgi:hypothetical protein
VLRIWCIAIGPRVSKWKGVAACRSRILPSLHETIRMIARPGGFLDRKSDGEPDA